MSIQLDIDSMFGGSMASPNEAHMACVLLLDTSASMEGESIRSLNEAVARFKYQICQDELAQRRVEIAIVTFGDVVDVLNPFTPIIDMPIHHLSASGRTPMAEAVQTAVDLVKERTHKYQGMGVPYYKPWIFMITDGASTSSDIDMEAAAARVRQEESKGSIGRLKFWALGVDNYDKNQLFRFTDRVVELREHDFTGIFDWLSKSMADISHSRVSDTVPLDDLPPNARKTKKDRSIDEDWL